MGKSSYLANFAIFFGGVLIASAMMAPYFLVRLIVIESIGAAGIILVIFGVLYRRFLASIAED